MASRFWVGGTGTWDASDTTHWAASSGAAGGQSVPGSGDTVTLDGSSGGGTVTMQASLNPTLQSITMGAFTGTLDINGNTVTLSTTTGFSGTGSGTRTLTLGAATINLNGASSTPWNFGTVTNLTFNGGSSTINMASAAGTGNLITFSGGGLTYGTVNITGSIAAFINSSNTISTLNVTGKVKLLIAANTTQTVTTLSVNGTQSSPVCIASNNSSATIPTVSVAAGSPTMTYAAFSQIAFAGGASFVATNSFDLGNNTGITINPPAGVSRARAFSRFG